MSMEIHVFSDTRLPSIAAWQQAIDAEAPLRSTQRHLNVPHTVLRVQGREVDGVGAVPVQQRAEAEAVAPRLGEVGDVDVL